MRTDKITPSFIANRTREAKQLAKESRITLQAAKDQIAVRLGYENWREMEQIAKRQSSLSEPWPGVGTFADVWAYLQTFRPSKAEQDSWLDGSEHNKFEYGDGIVSRYWMTGIRVGERLLTRSHLLPCCVETKNGALDHVSWRKPGCDTFGRDGGPAYIKLDSCGDVVWVEFWDGRSMHNEAAPAQVRILTRADDGRRFANFTFVKNGQWERFCDIYEPVSPTIERMSNKIDLEVLRAIGRISPNMTGRELMDAYFDNKKSVLIRFGKDEDAKKAQDLIESLGLSSHFHARVNGYHYCHVELFF